MNYTENLSLGLPGYGESADVAALNRNSGILDSYCYNTRQMECEPYDSTKTYMSGDLSIHNEVIYECNIDNTTGTWDDSKWDSTNLAEQIAKAKQSGGGQVTKEASGNPIELTDAASAPMVKCVTEIQGSQDLHGYSKPWVGGAGSNKWDEEWESGAIVLSSGADASSSIKIRSKNYIPMTQGNSYYFLHYATEADLFFYDSTKQYLGQASHISANSSTAFTVPSGASYVRFSILQTDYTNKIAINYPSTVTTYSPYSNICPITAYTEGEIEVRGKNLCSQADKTTSGSGYVIGTNAPDYINTDHTVFPAGTYTFSFNVSGASSGSQAQVIFYRDDSHSVGSKTGSVGTAGRKPYTITATKPFAKIQLYCNSSSGGQFTDFQLEKGDTLHDYEPYTSTTHTTTYPSAIYRGSEDVVNGEVVTEWGMIDSYAGETLPGEWISDRDEYAPGTTPTTGAQVAYELATPTTSSVTPTNIPIKSLSGYNHIESSTGDMEVEYITDAYQPLVDLIQISNGHTYSTQEQVVGKWIDGSTLYEKTIYCNGLSGTSDWTELDSSVAYGKLISADGVRVKTNECFSFSNSLGSDPRFQTKTDNKLYYYTSSTVDGDMYITFRYTKTTTTRSLNTSLNTQKAQIEPLTDKTEEVPTEEEKAVNEEENTNENR